MRGCIAHEAKNEANEEDSTRDNPQSFWAVLFVYRGEMAQSKSTLNLMNVFRNAVQVSQ